MSATTFQPKFQPGDYVDTIFGKARLLTPVELDCATVYFSCRHRNVTVTEFGAHCDDCAKALSYNPESRNWE